jgi:hypothetical protein
MSELGITLWLITRYHTPLDNMGQRLDYEAGARASGMNFWWDTKLPSRTTVPALEDRRLQAGDI